MTGWNAVKSRVEQLNLQLNDAQVKDATAKIKELADVRTQSMEDVDMILRIYHTAIKTGELKVGQSAVLDKLLDKVSCTVTSRSAGADATAHALARGFAQQGQRHERNPRQATPCRGDHCLKRQISKKDRHCRCIPPYATSVQSCTININSCRDVYTARWMHRLKRIMA